MHTVSIFVEDVNNLMSPACLIDASHNLLSNVAYDQERVVSVTIVHSWKYLHVYAALTFARSIS
jgi:hypothetical protein